MRLLVLPLSVGSANIRSYSFMPAAPAVSLKHVSVHCLGFKPSEKPGADSWRTVVCEFSSGGRPLTQL